MTESSDPTMDEVDPELFEEGINALVTCVKTMHELSDEVEKLADEPLTHADTVALLYGRRNDLNKTEIKSGFEAMELISSTDEDELIVRLLADLSDMNKSEAGEFVHQLNDLRRKYGSKS